MFASSTTRSTTLLKPTGRYLVGTTSFHLVDKNRIERHSKDENTHREWIVNAWYPTDATDNTSKTFYSNGMANLIKRRLTQFWRTPEDQFSYLDSLDHTPTNSWKNAPIRPSSTKYPVLFFSHGIGQSSFMYSSLIEEMASHGYVIFAIDHTYANLATLFPDGRLVENPDLGNSNKSLDEMKLILSDETNTWVQDIQFSCNQLELDTLIGNTFKDHIDLNKIGIFGQSLGGAAAIQVCRQDIRFKAGVNMDGAVQGKGKTDDIKKPFMLLLGKAFAPNIEISDDMQAKFNITKEEMQKTVGVFAEDIRKLYQGLSLCGYYILLPEADHAMFGDYMVLGNNIPETMKGKLSPNRATEIIRLLLADFFNYYLLNTKPCLMDDLKSFLPSEVTYETRPTM